MAVKPITSPLSVRRGALGDRLLAQLEREGRKVLSTPRDWPLVEQSIDGDRGAAVDVVRRLNRNGWLRNVRRGTYAIIDRAATTRLGALELVAHISEQPYMITAGRALTEAGLSDQAFKRIVVASPSRQRSWEWRGERVTYVNLPSHRIWGHRALPVGESLVEMATPERAILDSLAQPRWGVTLAQVTEAIDLALGSDPEFAGRLAGATERYAQATLARRLGLLIEALAGSNAALPFKPLIGDSRVLTPLRHRGSQDGEADHEWRVKVNVPLDLLLDHRYSG